MHEGLFCKEPACYRASEQEWNKSRYQVARKILGITDLVYVFPVAYLDLAAS